MQILTLTESAEKQIETLCNENECYGISLNLKGGGCAGFEYDWGTVTLATDLEEGDEVIKTLNGFAFVVGKHSTMFLIGTECSSSFDITKKQ